MIKLAFTLACAALCAIAAVAALEAISRFTDRYWPLILLALIVWLVTRNPFVGRI